MKSTPHLVLPAHWSSARTALCCLFLLVASTACGESGESGEKASPADALRLESMRQKSAALWIEGRIGDALKAIEPALETELVAYTDILNAGILASELSVSSNKGAGAGGADARAVALFERAIAARPEDPAPHFNLGVYYSTAGQLELAEPLLAKALQLAPDDLYTVLNYAKLLSELDKLEESEALFRQLTEAGPGDSPGIYASALYRLGQLLSWSGDAKGQEMIKEWSRLKETGVAVPSSEQMRRGNFGKITWPRPGGMTVAGGEEVTGPAAAYKLADQATALPAEFAGMTNLAAWTFVENWSREGGKSASDGPASTPEANSEPAGPSVGLSDLCGWGPKGLVIGERQPDGSLTARVLSTDPIQLTRAFDFDNDSDLDLLVVSGDAVRFFSLSSADGDRIWEELTLQLPALASAPLDVQPVDFDHEGDLDLLLVGEFGARIWRNDGFAVTIEKAKDDNKETSFEELQGRAQWVDATAEANLPTSKGFNWCAIEDFDTDQDVDLLMGGANGVFFADSLRGGVFADRTKDLSALVHLLANRPLIADLNGDAWPDFWIPGVDQSYLFVRLAGGGYVGAAAGGGQGVEVSGPTGVDLNSDGYLDAAWNRAGGGAGFALSLGAGSSVSANATVLDQALAVTWNDFDGDGAIDALCSYEDRAELRSGIREQGMNSLEVALLAKLRDNRRGVGAILELRAGPIYRRIFWTGEPVTLGLGRSKTAGILRVTWPRGVEQHDFDVAAGSRWAMERVQRIEGSCPFLYTWNGETYEFITDVLGITPLGLPMAPGMMVPPDHDEYVLVRGEQMKPRIDEDGQAWFDMQFTEELREVTYLDRLRLEVVDHPEGTEIFPNERFSFPPFPEAHTHVMRDPLVPLKATDHRGEDWTSQVASIDGDYAIPFESYEGLLTGLAKPHTLELSFDTEQLADAELLRLVCTGWFLWSDASINMAAARTPGVDFIPPILQVPDASAEGGWRNVGPPVGFPAGKRKTMVLDVTDFIDRADPRIRIFGTLCLYWDAIRLATDNDDEPLVVTHVEPASAKVWQRGFSRSFHPLPGHMLEWFDWDELDEPRWNQHPGSYTKFGEALPLMTAIDDQYAILGAGDALHARFSADNLPELKEGWRRDYLVFLDGWAKDRDPNTLEALYVEPLPFHGMSGYPYRADESFPDTEEHRQWRREWNTRPAKRWIEELAPGRSPEVALW